jgi:hypothetical protein
MFGGMPDWGEGKPPPILGESGDCERGLGPHSVTIVVPEDTEGDYQMAQAYFTAGETITGVVLDELDDVWLSVPPTDTEDNAAVLRLRREEGSAQP